MEHFDLDAAVRAGVLRSDQADDLRRFDESLRNAPGATEERFRLVSGFADIMAAVGIAMVAWAGIVVVALAPALGVVLPAVYWWGAKYFTEHRRMMLTSFILFAGFALSAAMGALAVALAVALVIHFGSAGPTALPLTGRPFASTIAFAPQLPAKPAIATDPISVPAMPRSRAAAKTVRSRSSRPSKVSANPPS